jgi:hypothetical protein
MGFHDPFRHLKHKLCPKKGRESNWQFDSRPLKVGNQLDFLAFRWHATYSWKLFKEGYNFALDLISIRGLHTKLWAPKSQGSQLWEFREMGVLGQNAIWIWALWRGTKYTIRGKVVVAPKSRLWWILWVQVCTWLVLAPKVLKLCSNQLVVWFVDLRVSNWCLSFFLVPIPEL